MPGAAAEPKTRRTTGRPVSRAPRRRMNAVVASLLPAPLGSGATTSYLASSEARADVGARFARGGRDRRQAPAPAPITACQQREGAADALARRTSGVADPLARRGADPPAGRTAILAPSSTVSARVERRRARRRTVLLAGGPAAVSRQAGRPLPARERSEPRRQHRPLKAGMTPSRRFRSGAGRSEATTASYGSSRLARRVRLFVLLVFASAPRSGQCARGRSADSRVELAPRAPRQDPSMARSALVGGGERLGLALIHGLASAPDERLRRHRARARPSRSCPELRPNPRPGGRQADPSVEHHVAG